MSPKLLARNPDLKRLRDDGYTVVVKSGLLVVDDIPYLNTRKEVQYGSLVSELTLAGEQTQRPSTHVINFIGEHPCDASGKPIAAIVNQSGKNRLAEDIIVDHAFSSKPSKGYYDDYYEKVVTYAKIISHPALSVNPDITVTPFKPVKDEESDSVFNYLDTATSRAGIGAANGKLAVNRVAIIGLGGSGSYLLDFLAKTPVHEIHLIDGDRYLQHNAFRSPGAPTLEELKEAPYKVEYFSRKYSAMRRGIAPHSHFASKADGDLLKTMSFVFLSMDAGPEKRELITILEEGKVPFIDVGMGVELADDALTGIVRATLSVEGARDVVRGRISMGGQGPDAAYKSNIQIAELNALSAVMAIIRWKKLCGFYFDGFKCLNITYLIGGNEFINEEEC